MSTAPPPPSPLPSGPELAALVRRAQTGHRPTLQALIETHQRLLYGFLMRQHPNPADCADLMQQTLVKMIERLGDLREPAAFRGWLLRIALNELRQLHRHHTRSPLTADSFDESPPIPDPSSPPDDILDARAALQRASAALGSLSPMQRQVITMRLDLDLSYADIATALDSSEGAVRVHFHNAIRRLKEVL